MAKKKGPKPDTGPEPSPDVRPEPGATPEATPKPKAGAKSKATPKPKAKAKSKAQTWVRRGPDVSPEGRAQQLVYEAFDAPGSTERVALARRAIELWEDCADAHLLLAEHAENRREAAGHFERAVAAGERAIGPAAFRDHVGHFWGLIETRPYMRAREALAHHLWGLGRRDEAVGHLREMLRLNPGDNQGVRYTLAGWLLILDRDDELGALLAAYDEDSATITYARTLLAFRRSGDSDETREALAAALASNLHVPGFLTSEFPLPSQPPDSYSPGDESEAAICAADSLPGWRATPGAIPWLRSAVAPRRRRPKAKAAPKAGKGPSAAAKAKLLKVERREVAWLADCRPLPQLVEERGELVQPWVAILASDDEERVFGQSVHLVPPSPADLFGLIAKAIEAKKEGEPHRPARVEHRPGPVWDGLKPHLEAIGIESVEVDAIPLMDALFADMAGHLKGDGPPGLLEIPGMSADRVASFFEAAAAFYRRAPWRSIGYEQAIRVDCPKFDGGPRFAVILGGSGINLGLALYDDLKVLKRLWSRGGDDEKNARETVALSLSFDEEIDTAPADVLASREQGWEVAGPGAFPTVFRKERGMTIRPPLPRELELLDGCLRALPGFVADRPQDDKSPLVVDVETASGPLSITLGWVIDG